MATYLSIHNVKKLSASTVQGGPNNCSPHITFDFEGETFENRGGITLFIGDAVLSARLIEAVNTIVAERRAELSAEQSQAAA